MVVTVWTDYICPWCYLGLDRTRYLRDLGVDTMVLPYELHPEIPEGGLPAKSSYRRLAGEYEAAGLPFRPPPRVVNSHFALCASETVRRLQPESFDAVHESLFAAYFAEGRDIGDRGTVLSIVEAAGVDVTVVLDAFENGSAPDWLRQSMDAARAAEVAGTPAWQFPNGLLVPGAQPREFLGRVVRRLSPGDEDVSPTSCPADDRG